MGCTGDLTERTRTPSGGIRPAGDCRKNGVGGQLALVVRGGDVQGELRALAARVRRLHSGYRMNPEDIETEKSTIAHRLIELADGFY